MPHALRDELVQEIFGLRKKKYTIRQIAFLLDIGRTTVKRYLRYPDHQQSGRPAHRRIWDRENRLGTHIGGKYHKIRVKKRPYPEACEMDGRTNTQLEWHHWDDEHLEWGLWLCNRCHKFVEGIDRGLTLEKYKELKEWSKTLTGPLERLETQTAVDVL